MELADVIKSLRTHWRVCVAIVLLTGLAMAIFLVTRKQVAPAARYKATIQVLVPAIDPKVGRPPGVPPSLLQGQNQRALSPSTRAAALDLARIPASQRHTVAFSFSSNATNDIIIMSASANDAATATTAAAAFESAYVATRSRSVADGALAGTNNAKSALDKLRTKLVSTEQDLGKADPALLAKVVNTAPGAPPVTAQSLPEKTPSDVVLLVVQRQAIINRIRGTEQLYASTSIENLIPSGFATVVEVDPPVQITPPLPSPFVPIVVFLAVGFALALGLPVLMDRLDHSIRTSKSAGLAFDSTVLASIPASRRFRRSLTVPGSPPDSAYRALAATSIATDRLPQAIVVMSPTGIVQDTVAANFAAALAGLGLRVALVATDSRQSWFLDTRRDESSNGSAEAALAFPDLLELAHQGRLNGELPRGLVKTRLHNLLVMPPGEESDDFSLDGLRPLLEALSAGGVDVTVIAGPALLEDPNATILAWTTRSVLWACETGEVTEGEAKEAAARLALAGATSFGVTMVDGKT